MFVFEAICLQIPKRDLLENTFCSAWVYVLHIYQITHILFIVRHTMCWASAGASADAECSAVLHGLLTRACDNAIAVLHGLLGVTSDEQ